MVEKKIVDESLLAEFGKLALKFNNAVFDLGLQLIEDYKTGNCRDANKTLEAIIEIYKAPAPKN